MHAVPADLIQHTATDSVRVAGWLLGTIHHALPGLPGGLLVGLSAFLTWLLLDLGETLLNTVGRKVPGLAQLVAVWQDTPLGSRLELKDFINPALAILLGIVGSGSGWVGVLAAGLRSMLPPLLKPPTVAAVRATAGAVLMVGLLVGPAFAGTTAPVAGGSDPAASATTFPIRPEAFIGEHYADLSKLSDSEYRSAFAGVGLRYVLTRHIVPKLELRHDLGNGSGPWALEGRLVLTW